MQNLPIADYEDYAAIIGIDLNDEYEHPAFARQNRYCKNCQGKIEHGYPAHFCTKSCHALWLKNKQDNRHDAFQKERYEHGA